MMDIPWLRYCCVQDFSKDNFIMIELIVIILVTNTPHVHENSEGLSSAANPKPKGLPSMYWVETQIENRQKFKIVFLCALLIQVQKI